MKTMSIKEYAIAHKLSIYNVVKMTKNGTLKTVTKKVDGKDELFIVQSDDTHVERAMPQEGEEKIGDYEKAYFKLKIHYEKLKIKYEALEKKKYTFFVKEDTVLPMMYMPDCIKGTIELMEAEPSKIKVRTSYNFAGISFSTKELAEEVKKHIPEFEDSYEPDFRQKIADSWPKSIDDSDARKDWGWKHEYDLAKMTTDMLEKLKIRLVKE